ncbi:hypothetical protein C7412_108158 [Paraburkholderia silvatlantica]|nr:hypothetical protein C7412_108158 [Paraburkholderia silvatlantica]
MLSIQSAAFFIACGWRHLNLSKSEFSTPLDGSQRCGGFNLPMDPLIDYQTPNAGVWHGPNHVFWTRLFATGILIRK